MAQEPTVVFKWVTTSPEPHDVTMRNSLEPIDVFVEVEVPVEEKYLANFKAIKEHQLKLVEYREAEIKAELYFDAKSPGKNPGPYPVPPSLTVDGLRYVVSQLSGNGGFTPEVEEEDWDESTEDEDDWDADSSDEEWDEAEEDIDWEDE